MVHNGDIYMSAELYVDFENINWYIKNKEDIKYKINGLTTYVESDDDSFWLCEVKKEKLGPKDWAFAIRIFLEEEYIFLEISTHSPKVSKDLKDFLGYLRKKTIIRVRDEDHEEADW